MSVWTHVAAVFRIDGIRDEKALGGYTNGRRDIDWDKITGRTIYKPRDILTDDDYEIMRMTEDFDAYHKHPKRFVPTGSEGSLQRLVWRNPDRSCAARFTVTVFGDLRDYSDVDAIKEWFYGVCRKCSVRQAVCEVECLDAHVFRWGEEEEEENG